MDPKNENIVFEEDGIQIRKYLNVLFRRKNLILLVFSGLSALCTDQSVFRYTGVQGNRQTADQKKIMTLPLFPVIRSVMTPIF